MELSLRKAALTAGIGYVVIFVLGLITNFSVFEKLIVSGDAAATTKNISENITLFRLGTASWIIVLICDIVIAWALYILFKPVSNSGSLLVSFFRLIYIAVFAASLVNLVSIIHLVTGPATETQQSQVMLFTNAYTFGFHFGIIFFGVHIILLGCLMLRSRNTSRILAVLLIVAGIGYLVDSFGNLIVPAYAANKTAALFVVALPAIVAELALTIWLLLYAGKQKNQS